MSTLNNDAGDEPLRTTSSEARQISQLDRARDSRSQILSRLWAGNAGGAVTTLSAMALLSRSGTLPPTTTLWPLGSFILGLILLGGGAIFALVAQVPALRESEDATSIMDVKLDHIRRPSEHAGFSFNNAETVTGLLAALTFAVGVLAGFASLLLELVP